MIAARGRAAYAQAVGERSSAPLLLAVVGELYGSHRAHNAHSSLPADGVALCALQVRLLAQGSMTPSCDDHCRCHELIFGFQAGHDLGSAEDPLSYITSYLDSVQQRTAHRQRAAPLALTREVGPGGELAGGEPLSEASSGGDDAGVWPRAPISSADKASDLEKPPRPVLALQAVPYINVGSGLGTYLNFDGDNWEGVARPVSGARFVCSNANCTSSLPTPTPPGFSSLDAHAAIGTAFVLRNATLITPIGAAFRATLGKWRTPV
jgi:hypothetical protein